MKKIFLPLFIFSLLLGGTMLSGCNKKKDTIAKIYVRAADNSLVAGVRVILYGEATNPNQQGKVNIADTAISNSAGEAIFNLNYMYNQGQWGVAVLNISAKKDLTTGSGIIKVEQEVVNEETVFVQ